MSCHRPEGAAVATHPMNGPDHNAFDAMVPRAPQAIPKEARNGAARSVPPALIFHSPSVRRSQSSSPRLYAN